MRSEEQDNLRFVETWVDAYNSGDAERFVDLHANDAEMVFASRDLRVKGRTDILSAVRAMLVAFPDRIVVVHQRVASGDVVAIEATFEGTSSGVHPEFPAGQKMSVPCAVFLTLRDGQIISDHSYA